MMKLISILGFVILLTTTITTFVIFSRKSRALDKYEFENRTQGGAIEFATFEDAEKHRLKRSRLNLVTFFLIIPQMFFLFVFTVGTFA